MCFIVYICNEEKKWSHCQHWGIFRKVVVQYSYQKTSNQLTSTKFTQVWSSEQVIYSWAGMITDYISFLSFLARTDHQDHHKHAINATLVCIAYKVGKLREANSGNIHTCKLKWEEFNGTAYIQHGGTAFVAKSEIMMGWEHVLVHQDDISRLLPWYIHY